MAKYVKKGGGLAAPERASMIIKGKRILGRLKHMRWYLNKEQLSWNQLQMVSLVQCFMLTVCGFKAWKSLPWSNLTQCTLDS